MGPLARYGAIDRARLPVARKVKKSDRSKKCPAGRMSRDDALSAVRKNANGELVNFAARPGAVSRPPVATLTAPEGGPRQAMWEGAECLAYTDRGEPLGQPG